ncbi:hypothetical protein E4V51_32620, partial [Paenibacillus sp. 28ISP30-2]|nr:hypothetical protein [Paenibacillus sp. 28ISP30-2]
MAEQPVQVVYRHKNLGFRYEDARERDEAVAAFVAQDKARGFDLRQHALMRVPLFRTGQSTYRFVWSFHPIVIDCRCLSLVTGELFITSFASLVLKLPVLTRVQPS